MPDKQPPQHDPAKHPEWVRDESGMMVPYTSPLQAKEERIRDARIAREQAAVREIEAQRPVAGHGLVREDDGGRSR